MKSTHLENISCWMWRCSHKWGEPVWTNPTRHLPACQPSLAGQLLAGHLLQPCKYLWGEHPAQAPPWLVLSLSAKCSLFRRSGQPPLAPALPSSRPASHWCQRRGTLIPVCWPLLVARPVSRHLFETWIDCWWNLAICSPGVDHNLQPCAVEGGKHETRYCLDKHEYSNRNWFSVCLVCG